MIIARLKLADSDTYLYAGAGQWTADIFQATPQPSRAMAKAKLPPIPFGGSVDYFPAISGFPETLADCGEYLAGFEAGVAHYRAGAAGPQTATRSPYRRGFLAGYETAALLADPARFLDRL